MFILILLFFLFAWLLISNLRLLRLRYLSKKASEAARKEYEAYSALSDWRFANPNIPIGLSSEGRRLILEYTAAWQEFLKTHSYIKDNGCIELLYFLLNDKDPSPPGKGKRPPKKPQNTEANFFLKKNVI
ncbi:hypothetical protein IIA95_01050 [Patescibacteria group bacterium]|nr:hypothetical protein [Patescibacteria group bacterium]